MFFCSSEPLVWCKFGINWTPNLSFAKSLRGFKENRKTNKKNPEIISEQIQGFLFVCFFKTTITYYREHLRNRQ